MVNINGIVLNEKASAQQRILERKETTYRIKKIFINYTCDILKQNFKYQTAKHYYHPVNMWIAELNSQFSKQEIYS